MVTLPFPEWRPDWNDLNGQHTQLIRGVVPRADGYGPFYSIEAFTQTLPAVCRGYYAAQMEDGTVRVFAGTAERLYLLDNTTLQWSDVSKDGLAYSEPNPNANWVFAQFNNVLIATHQNDDMQAFNLTSSTEFDDLGGSPPRAGWVATVGRFLVAGDLASDPFRIQWSGLNEITNWTAGTNSSDFQDLPDQGRVRSIVEVSGDVGLVCQEAGARRMTFSPGSEFVFQIDRLENVPGILCPYSIVVSTGGAYYLSTKGFVLVSADGAMVPIGEERVDRMILGEITTPDDIAALAYDDSNPQLMVGAADPRRNIIVFGYKSIAGGDLIMDAGLVYHTTLRRWSPVSISAYYIAPVARPGLTLESLDAIAPGALTISDVDDNGSGAIRVTVSSTASLTTGQSKTISGVGGTTEANGTWTITVIDGTRFDLDGSTYANNYTSGGVVGGSIDDLPFTLDEVSTASLPAMSAIGADSKLGFFSGASLEAELVSAEQSMSGRRFYINGIRPLTDAETVFGSVLMRDKLNGAATEGIESEMDDDGYCPLLDEARHARAKIRIPAGEVWSYASGVEPDVEQAGQF
jgi:hypothetical protein